MSGNYCFNFDEVVKSPKMAFFTTRSKKGRRQGAQIRRNDEYLPYAVPACREGWKSTQHPDIFEQPADFAVQIYFVKIYLTKISEWL